MAKRRLIAFIFALVLLTSCVYLGILPKERLYLKEILNIYKLLDEVKYPQEYEFGVFDCSNATALLYDYFTKKGFKCEIMVGWQPPWQWHSWLIIKKTARNFGLNQL